MSYRYNFFNNPTFREPTPGQCSLPIG